MNESAAKTIHFSQSHIVMPACCFWNPSSRRFRRLNSKSYSTSIFSRFSWKMDKRTFCASPSSLPATARTWNFLISSGATWISKNPGWYPSSRQLSPRESSTRKYIFSTHPPSFATYLPSLEERRSAGRGIDGCMVTPRSNDFWIKFQFKSSLFVTVYKCLQLTNGKTRIVVSFLCGLETSYFTTVTFLLYGINIVFRSRMSWTPYR